MLRGLLLLCVVLASAPLAGCESCEFSFGSLQTTGTVHADVAPLGLRVQTCEEPEGVTCLDGVVGPADDGSGKLGFTAWTPSEGYWTCSFAKHYLVVTADNCEPAVVDVLMTDPAVPTPIALVLSCS